MSPLHSRNYVIIGRIVRSISNYADLMPNIYWRGLLASSIEKDRTFSHFRYLVPLAGR
jgi:hypothetical protein